MARAKPGDRSGFFERVRSVVRMIPPGQTASYGQIAAIVSHRGAARTVGWALHGLDEDTDVPWHRVVKARGEISTGGWSGDLNVQRMLLEEEGVTFDEEGRVNPRHRWPGLTWPEIEALRATWKNASGP
jgi:methylated-DNA-protein-cysteine methyltransferase-like protein